MKGWLVLESGESFEGDWVSADTPGRAGEIVFNTSHAGYEEIATDPSYFSQIVVMTMPMQGNYGVDPAIWESKKIWIEGFVCLEMQSSKRESGWKNLLAKNDIPALHQVDTREVVEKLRQQGTPWGALVPARNSLEAVALAKNLISQAKDKPRDWAFIASRKERELIKGDIPIGARVAVIDFGCKENILRELKARASVIEVFPSRVSAEEVLQWSPDGVMLTNGPGDPGDVEVAPQTVKALLNKVPIFGICMGHQVLSIALGAKTYKLKFGHRGSNHPIEDQLLNRIYMTSQNHGYGVDASTLPGHVKVTHVNLNDRTVAGFFSEELNCLGIQYHPESRPGPHDASSLFDFFFNQMINKGKK